MAYYIENGLSKYDIGEEVSKTVKIINEIYYYDESGYGVYTVESGNRSFKIAGIVPSRLKVYKFYRVTGIIEARDNEKQLKISSYKYTDPKSKSDIIDVLRLLPGLDIKAARLYELIGPGVLGMLREEPDKVHTRSLSLGLDYSRYVEWSNLLRGESDESDALDIFTSLGVSPTKAKELIKDKGVGVAFEIRKNPYMLMSTGIRMSFPEVDMTALTIGTEPAGVYRLSEAICYVLRKAAVSGHTAMEMYELVDQVRGLTEISVSKSDVKAIRTHNLDVYCLGNSGIPVDRELLDETGNIIFSPSNTNIKAALDILNGHRIMAYKDDGDVFIQSKNLYDAEDIIARKVNALASAEIVDLEGDNDILDKYLDERGISLEKRQYEAARMVTRSRGGLFVITGPAGSGKTFLLRVILDVLKQKYEGIRASCLAPTGKAAKLISSSTGLPASTIHRFTGRISSGYYDGSSDIYIIDEFSMVDTELASWLFKDIPDSSKVIILGDTDQLPSIGPGAVLRDLLNCKAVPHVALDTVKRQAAGSGVLLNANRIRAGEDIQTEILNENGAAGNAYVMNYFEDPVETIVGLARQRGLAFFQQEMVQVLVPMRKGKTGSYAFNFAIQQAINPYDGTSERIKTGLRVNGEDLYFQTGDKVIHTVNDYSAMWHIRKDGEYLLSGKQGIMNGETGVIEAIIRVPTGAETSVLRIIVKYGEEYVFYEGDSVFNLLHAYAITIHKSQGSQWDEVYSVITPSDAKLLNRKILYTLVTRASDTIFLMAGKKALEIALNNIEPNLRVTGLPSKVQLSYNF